MSGYCSRASRIAGARRADLEEEGRRPQARDLAPVFAKLRASSNGSSHGVLLLISGQKEVYLHHVVHAAQIRKCWEMLNLLRTHREVNPCVSSRC